MRTQEQIDRIIASNYNSQVQAEIDAENMNPAPEPEFNDEPLTTEDLELIRQFRASRQ